MKTDYNGKRCCGKQYHLNEKIKQVMKQEKKSCYNTKRG